MLNVLAYVRVSTEKQGERGGSLNTQEHLLREFARYSQLKIVKVYRDTDSALGEENFSQRSGFNAVTERALATGWPIIVASSDRFSRTGSSYDRFTEAGGRVYAADVGFGADEAVVRGQIKRAEINGRRIVQRAAEGRRKARERNVKFGNPRLSEARPKAAAALSENARLRREEFEGEWSKVRWAGAFTPRQIAAAFNATGYVTARGLRWTAANVARMLREPRPENAALDGAAVQEPNTMPLDDGDDSARALEREIDEIVTQQPEPDGAECYMSNYEREMLRQMIEDLEAL